MKAAFILAAAGLVAAQDFSGQPRCALQCLQENIPEAGCDLDDTACQCSPDFQEKLLPIITPCLTQACEASDLVRAQSASRQACEDFARSAGGSATGTSALSISIPTTVTGSASLPAIFSSSVTEQLPVPTPGRNGTATGTESGAATPTGTSGPGASGAPGSGASAAAPAFGMLAAIAAVLAL
ncbi:hypothetical protein F66182_9859 [Fusarium sp. NRRL 66182]|nr:hypothetical protein F66182_9859 [Fusarium sp. NRRL 66182]